MARARRYTIHGEDFEGPAGPKKRMTAAQIASWRNKNSGPFPTPWGRKTPYTAGGVTRERKGVSRKGGGGGAVHVSAYTRSAPTRKG